MTVARHHGNLIYISAGEKSHVLVKDLSRVVLRQYNNDNNKRYFCQHCFNGCTTEEYRKTMWKDASYMGHKESSSKKLATRSGMAKSSLEKPNTNYVFLLSSTQVLKVYYVNKARVSHHHQNPSPPITNITYHVGAASW